MLRRPIALVVSALLCAGVLTGCSANRAPAAGEGGFIAGDGSTIVLATNKRGAPVNLAGPTLTASNVNVATYRGQVVILNIWASWCAPCRAEAPGLQTGWQTWQHEGGVQFIGINTRDDFTSAQQYVSNFKITYPNIFDKFGQKLLELGTQLPPNAIPSTLILDKSGRVAARILGQASPALIDGIVSALKKESVA